MLNPLEIRDMSNRHRPRISLTFSNPVPCVNNHTVHCHGMSQILINRVGLLARVQLRLAPYGTVVMAGPLTQKGKTTVMISITNVAPDKKAGMSLGDLRRFVADCLNRDVPDDAEIKVQVGWAEQIPKITASEPER
jgi:hypothetical protein